MNSATQTVEEYLNALSSDRRTALASVRTTILNNLPKGYEEIMLYGMICYVIPLETYPKTYNGQPLMLLGLASKKNHMSLHLLCVYINKEMNEWFVKEYHNTGKKLDMGKGCVRFKKLDDLPLELIGKVVAKVPVSTFIEHYEMSRK